MTAASSGTGACLAEFDSYWSGLNRVIILFPLRDWDFKSTKTVNKKNSLKIVRKVKFMRWCWGITEESGWIQLSFEVYFGFGIFYKFWGLKNLTAGIPSVKTRNTNWPSLDDDGALHKSCGCKIYLVEYKDWIFSCLCVTFLEILR